MYPWWMVRPRWSPEWSPEERKTVLLIHAIGMSLFAISCYAMVMYLFSLGLDPLIVVAVSVAPPFIGSLLLARKISEYVWPDLVVRADANAASRRGDEASP
ncbi:MAG: hypothetical protein JO108_33820 [Acidobacteriaceae bacterium]|nr:hypothetical protein [Acidobacteriaceae bacterium]